MQGGQTTRATTVAGMLWALVALLLAHFAQTFGHVCALDAHARRQAGLWLREDALTVLGLAGAIAVIWQAGRDAPAPRRQDVLLRLGEASFGIYLSWIFVEAAVVGALRLLDPGAEGRAALMLLGFLATMATGWCAWRWVEVPAHRWILARAAAPGGVAPPLQRSSARTSG
jgi:peptidoglycan/LPS O-acetylase OafA/YrhL